MFSHVCAFVHQAFLNILNLEKKKKKKNDKINMKKLVFLFSRFEFLKRNLEQVVKETFTLECLIIFF